MSQILWSVLPPTQSPKYYWADHWSFLYSSLPECQPLSLLTSEDEHKSSQNKNEMQMFSDGRIVRYCVYWACKACFTIKKNPISVCRTSWILIYVLNISTRLHECYFMFILSFFSFFLFRVSRPQSDLHAQFEGPSQVDISPSSHDKKESSFRKMKKLNMLLIFFTKKYFIIPATQVQFSKGLRTEDWGLRT